jgi:hypothetical protein
MSAAKAGASSVPAAITTATANAAANGLQRQVTAVMSDLFSSLPSEEKFDLMIASPPSFAREPLDMADRAWHAQISRHRSFVQASLAKYRPRGQHVPSPSSDSDVDLFHNLITSIPERLWKTKPGRARTDNPQHAFHEHTVVPPGRTLRVGSTDNQRRHPLPRRIAQNLHTEGCLPKSSLESDLLRNGTL